LKAVILAAGIGSRLGKRLPKSLTELTSGETIISNQINLLKNIGIRDIVIVVGFKKEVLMEEYPEVLYRYNPYYHITNTSKSLLMALESIEEDDTIWLNGDVYLDEEVLIRVANGNGNIIAVNTSECGEEEVKYKTDGNGKIIEISKKVKGAEGEAVGVNKILKKDFNTFIQSLKECDDNDYFEKGIENSIKKGVKFSQVDISDCICVEVDFKKDLDKVNKTLEL